MNEKSSRSQIIDFLKKAEWLTVSELSQKVGITPMAIRQHLLSLEKQGIIRYAVKKTGIGRPVFLYRLTARADSIFPKSYGKFINDMLQGIESLDGKKKVDKIFKFRKDKMLSEKLGVINEFSTLHEKVATLAEILNQDGYMVELDELDDGFSMKQFNCPIAEVSANYSGVCKYELELYRDLLGTSVKRLQCQADGNASCTYHIPI